MNIFVCIKQVPSTNKVQVDEKTAIVEGVEYLKADVRLWRKADHWSVRVDTGPWWGIKHQCRFCDDHV